MNTATVETLLRRCAQHLGSPLPVRDGGAVFRAVAMRLDLRTEQVSDVARELGLWPYSNAQISALINPLPGERYAEEPEPEPLPARPRREYCPNPPKDALTTREAARLLGLTPAHTLDLGRAGVFPLYYVHERRVLCDRDGVLRELQRRLDAGEGK